MAFRLLRDAQGHRHDESATIREVSSSDEDDFAIISLRTKKHVNREEKDVPLWSLIERQVKPPFTLSCKPRASAAFHLPLPTYAMRTIYEGCLNTISKAVFAYDPATETIS